MSETMRNFMVGLFVLASITVLAVLMVWFGESPDWLGGNEWTLKIVGVKELSGINQGTPVNLNGVEIGRVKGLGFIDPKRPDHGVVINAGIKRDFVIPRGAHAKLYGPTLGIGNGHVEIVVKEGADRELLDRSSAVIQGEMRSVIGEMISTELVSKVEKMITNIGELSAAATPAAENLAKLMEQHPLDQTPSGAGGVEFTGNLATAFARLDQLVANLNAILGDKNVRGDVIASIRDLKEITQSLKETAVLWKTETHRLSDNINKRVDQTGDNMESSFRRLNMVLDNLDESTSTLVRILHRVDAGEGTAGLLTRDARLYEAAVVALQRFGELTATLQRIVGKAERDGYVTIRQGMWTVPVATGEVAAKLIEKIPNSSATEPLSAANAGAGKK